MTDYPSNLDVRPLTTWPGELLTWSRRRRSNFSAPLTATLRTLSTELREIGARSPVLEVAIPPDQFRIDGRPRANAREEHPGVVLSLPHTNVGALRYASDTFDRWKDNLRAIALGLEALRKVDRYGITRRGEQYAGFRALPPGKSPIAVEPQMTVDEAAQFLLDAAGDATPGLVVADVLNHLYVRETVYRSAAKRLHPDVGGDTESFQNLQDAKRVLDGAR